MTGDIIFLLDKIASKIVKKTGILSFFPHADRKQVVQRYVERHFKKLALDISNLSDASVESNSYTNNTIWVFWAQGKDVMPPIVKSCVRQIDNMKGDYRLIVLDKDTYKDYVNIPEVILRKLDEGKITQTHFSDILRSALLQKYGGWWMDATIYPVKPIEQKKSLYSIKLNYMPKYISGAQWSSFLWYMPAGHKMARFLSAAWLKYWEENDGLVEYFLTDHLIKLFYDTDADFRKEIDSLPIENKWLYFMQRVESDEKFDVGKWQTICEDTRFFKCNWRGDVSNNAFTTYKKIFCYEQ